MDHKILRTVAREFADLDLSAENTEIERLNVEVKQAEAAVVAAEERRREIARAISDFRGPSGRDVARALLDGRSPSDAAMAGPDIPTLEREKEALTAGIRDLQHLAQDLRAEISNVEGQARAKIMPSSQRVSEMIAGEAKALIEQIVPLYAALAAVSTTTRAGANILNKLRDVIQAAHGFHGFSGYGRKQEIPSETVEVLSKLDGKGPALKVQFLTIANL